MLPGRAMKNRWLGAGIALMLAAFMAVPVSAQGPPLPTPTPIHIVIEEKITVGDASPRTSGEVIEEQVAVVDEIVTSDSVIDESVQVVDEVDVEVSGEDEPEPIATPEPEPTETPPKATATSEASPAEERKSGASCNSSSGSAASMGHLGLITAPLMLYALRRLGRG